MDSQTMCRIEETDSHGKAMVATKKIEPGPLGLLVFKEEALLAIPTRGTPRDNSGREPEFLAEGAQLWTDWWFYRQQPKGIRDRILRMYKEMDCSPANALRNYLHEQQEKIVNNTKNSQEEKYDYGDDDDDDDGSGYVDSTVLENIEEFVQFAMVVRFNSVELCPPNEDGSGPGTDYGHGLFENACKLNHSCKPNCAWLTTQDGKAKEIRAIATIEEGEELTIDYVGNALESIPQRRQELLTTKGFICQCDRCSAENGDDTRRFECVNHKNSACPGVHFLHQPSLSSEPELLCCTHCGSFASKAYTESVLKEEKELGEEIQEVDEEAGKHGLEEVSGRIAKLRPPHDLHRLAEKCYGLQADLYSSMGYYRAAAEGYAKQLNCRLAILGNNHRSQQTAFCCERLGDVLQHVNVQEAEEAYKRTVRVLQVMRGGPADPYSKCALTKLVTVQSKRVNDEEQTLPHLSCVEGIAESPDGSPETNHPCEVCGNPSIFSQSSFDEFFYCCDEHKRIHLAKVYKE